MSLVNLSVKHGQTLDEARARLERTVGEAVARFGSLIQHSEWSSERDSVLMTGPGFQIQMRVDAESVHVAADIPLIGQLFGNRFLAGLKGILAQTFQKRLP